MAGWIARDKEPRGASAVGEGVSEAYESDRQLAQQVAALLAVESVSRDLGVDSTPLLRDPQVQQLLARVAEKAAVLSRTVELGLDGTFIWGMLDVDPEEVARVIAEHDLIEDSSEGRNV